MTYKPPEAVNNDPNKDRAPDFYKKGPDGKEVLYADFDFNLTTHPVTKDIVIRKNEKAIKQSLENLVLTSYKEIVMEPDIGGGVNQALFDFSDAVTVYNLSSRIKKVIDNFEPRIELDDLQVYRTDDMHGVIIVLKYYIKNQSTLITEKIVLDKLK